MYNRYIGNTGQFYRVDEFPSAHKESVQEARVEAQEREFIRERYNGPDQGDFHRWNEPHFHNSGSPIIPPPEPRKPPPFFGGGLRGLGGTLNAMLPFGMDIGDLLLLLLLFFLYLESGDEEF